MKIRAIVACTCLLLCGIAAPKNVGATAHYGTATIGAPLADWLHTYGAPMRNTGGDVPGWLPCANHVTAGLQLTLLKGRAYAITRQRCDEDAMLPVAARRRLALRFFPKDAVPIGTATTANGDVWIYRSAALAKTHLLGLDCDGNDTPPGTFAFSYNPDGDDGSWSVSMGNCG